MSKCLRSKTVFIAFAKGLCIISCLPKLQHKFTQTNIKYCAESDKWCAAVDVLSWLILLDKLTVFVIQPSLLFPVTLNAKKKLFLMLKIMQNLTEEPNKVPTTDVFFYNKTVNYSKIISVSRSFLSFFILFPSQLLYGLLRENTACIYNSEGLILLKKTPRSLSWFSEETF